MEKNIISLEQRLSHEINQVKLSLELDIQGAKKEVELIDDADIFTVLERMDYAISQLRPKKEQTTALLNQVRLNTDEFTRLLKKNKVPKVQVKHLKSES
jgi:molecular chaperone GrpE (heat shock protein)